MSKKGRNHHHHDTMPKETGSIEGFYRATRPHAAPPPPPSRHAPVLQTPSPSRLSTEVTAEEFESKLEQTVLSSSPVISHLDSPGRPGLSARQRSSKAAKSLSSYRDDTASPTMQKVKTCDLSSISMVCTVYHHGMEVFFASVPTKRAVLGVCSRTRVVLQTLKFPDSLDDKATIVSLLSNPQTGMVSVGFSDGIIQTYRPVAVKAAPLAEDSSSTLLVRPFGKFRWLPGPPVHCREVFYHDGDERADLFTPSSVDISSSGDDKMLVAHRDQLAVFDVAPAQTEGNAIESAELLWTTRMDASIVTAKLSGDGRAIVVVVEGEGVGNANPYGARTFIRDADDGSNVLDAATVPRPETLERAPSSGTGVGIVYKPGPFLIHSTPVSRISFRGFGHVTSNVRPDEDEGNDLLLTYCEEDESVRIFSQNSWKQLMHWNTPPNSRADWVRGISAFNLGDLESRKKQGSSSAPSSRRPSIGSADESGSNINANLPGNRGMPSVPISAGPTSAAGAWIAELTFRNSFPALRLSRLSYMKRGADESHPAHFESVAAILPSSSLEAGSVLEAGELGLSVEGIWPAWLPWTSGEASNEGEAAPGGSAMALLGLSPGALPSSGAFGDSHRGGTHGPPSELRVVASHPKTGKVVVMEFPLWGDLDFGAMELGNPLRYLLALSEASDLQRALTTDDEWVEEVESASSQAGPVCVEYESDVLCAQIQRHGTSVELTWRRPAAMSIIPASPTELHAALSVPDSVESEESYDFEHLQAFKDTPDVFQDVSVVPVPISLPSLRLPRSLAPGGREKVVSVHWWKDQTVGRPYLIAATSSGALVVYELPPPWSTLEPSMPNFDPFQISRSSSMRSFETGDIGTDESDEESERREYDVMITPHPDFGIGLRLEAQPDGKPAIAGSYKKHPLNGGMLPAERTGMIVLGDEVLSVNGVSLEGISFEDIIATVRKVGSETKKGEPICLRFRPSPTSRLYMARSAALTGSQRSEGNGRRSIEQMLGVARRQSFTGDAHKIDTVDSDGADSHVSMLVGAGSEMQQEFSRVVSVVPKAVPAESMLVFLPRREVEVSGASLTKTILLVVVSGCCVSLKELDYTIDGHPENGSCREITSLNLKGKEIASVDLAEHEEELPCLFVTDADGIVSLIILDIEENLSSRNEPNSLRFNADLRHYPMSIRGPTFGGLKSRIRASSAQLVGCLARDENRRSVAVWCARPSPWSPSDGSENDEIEDGVAEYSKALICVDSFCSDDRDELVDFRFVRTGHLDAFPLVVTMTQTSAVVHRRAADRLDWEPVVALRYSTCDDLSNVIHHGVRHGLSPSLLFPHLISSVLSLVSVTDEHRCLKPDWHPDAVLAFACTEARGAGVALKRNVTGVFTWLSSWMNPDENARPSYSLRFPLAAAPIKTVGGDALLQDGDVIGGEVQDAAAESASGFMSLMPKKESNDAPVDNADALLKELQRALCRPRRDLETNERSVGSEVQLPAPLSNLSMDELRLLWAMGEILAGPPRFKNLDSGAQLTLFCLSLVRALKTPVVGSNGDDAAQSTPNPLGMFRPAFFVKSKPAPQADEVKCLSTIASAACVSAIASSSQGRLLQSCRVGNEKFDWDSARELRIPLWLRSTSELKKISEEIGQSVYRQSKDIMESAIFFIIVRNSRTLRNLAVTDQSESGKKFSKFITSFDFSSERGRKAAEKNAYSLLRKRKYRAAASFFLLTEPPMLKTALEVIVTQMQDFELAFMTARLIENAPKTEDLVGGLSSTAFGGMMGGGAGFASGDPTASSVGDDDIKFDQWTSDIGPGTRDLIRSRGIPDEASSDLCLSALLHIWLGQREKGARCLCGLSSNGDCDAVSLAYFGTEQKTKIPRSIEVKGVHGASKSNKSDEKKLDYERVVSKANSVINFASCPFLVTAIEASDRTRWAATLLVSRALSRRGLDLQAARALMQNTDKADFSKVPIERRSQKHKEAKTVAPGPPEASSIFDSYDAPQPAKVKSIFESFDVPQQQTKAPPAEAVSSIFDSFDAPPTRPPKPSTTSSGPVSSIFDDFDAAPQLKKKPQESGVPESSIFDSFDTAPQKTKTEPSNTVGQAASSIFDSYNAAPPETKAVEQSGDTSWEESASHPLPEISGPHEREEVDSDDSPLVPAEVWKLWRENILLESLARRLIREITSIIAPFRGDALDAPIALFRKRSFPLVPSSVGEILHGQCEGDYILTRIKSCTTDVCSPCSVNEDVVVRKAMQILSSEPLPERLVFTVLLCSASNRDLDAESTVRQAAAAQIERCGVFSISNDDLVASRRTTHHVASQYARRIAARVSWQLEICLWLHRGGALPLSSLTVKQCIAGVRLGLAVASWGRSPECLEAMIRCEPDSPIDDEAGRQLWSSMKLISGLEDKAKKMERVSSGGWEFLVECRRDEATEMLRNRSCGSFLIRPHPAKTGVFTLSFKTNLVPTQEDVLEQKDEDAAVELSTEDKDSKKPSAKPVKKDDVVQHAVIRLSDTGFRCGSFGPFSSLMDLLEAVSASLPFDLLFSAPPTQAMIKDEGSQPSPNAVFLRKFALSAHSERYRWNDDPAIKPVERGNPSREAQDSISNKGDAEIARRRRFGMFLQLIILSEIRKQLSAVVAADLEGSMKQLAKQNRPRVPGEEYTIELPPTTADSHSDGVESVEAELAYAVASRIIRPLLTWCRVLETAITPELAPGVTDASCPFTDESATGIAETAITERGDAVRGDAIIRRMIQRESGVEFRTIRVGEAGDTAMIVLFGKTEALKWLVKSGLEENEEGALARLDRMERRRVIEAIESTDLTVKPVSGTGSKEEAEKVRYRFVDPWEVEVLDSRDAETLGASLGREHFYEFSVPIVARSCEDVFRHMGGVHLLGLWAYAKGGMRLTKAIASVHAPWERDAGGDLQMSQGSVIEPPPFANSIRQHLYRNDLFRRLRTPQRFLALVQVELLDLKNLTSPGGSPSLSVYALLRLKRPGSSTPLSLKARTLDSAATPPVKVGKSSGPNAPASWGSVVRFRFPLPEGVNCDGASVDEDREALFKGPPSVLQIAVYEKKFMNDVALGDADVKLDGLANGGQMEEWVPLRSQKHGHSGSGGISWFARIRLTLRFELMCIESESSDQEHPHSVGLTKIKQLSKLGGAYEDTKGITKSSSTTDLFSYIESNFF